MTTTVSNFIKIHPKDNVAVALATVAQGTLVNIDGVAISLLEDIPKGHKVALRNIHADEDVIKYGFPIGHVTLSVQQGRHIHSHNLATNLHDLQDYQYIHEMSSVAPIVDIGDQPVSVYRRSNGEVGIRNELWIIPTVTCVNAIADLVKAQFLKKYPELEIDGIEVLKHPYGCSQLGEDHLNTRVILQNMVKHPNAGAVLVMGLGCENNQVKAFQETLGEYDSERVKFMVCQQENDEIEVASQLVDELYQVMKRDQRSVGKLSEIKLGLECGGSDAFSGISANPLLGLLSDYMINIGGTTVLTEVPEMFGAEQTLMNRAQSAEVFHDIVAMINGFKQYFIDHQQPIYENPSPGNKDGGITTLEEKSLGCTQKSGDCLVVDVLKYGERLTVPGLNLLSAPGNDAVATTALIASGCHIVLFSTGRGTPYGGFAPTIKIATNSELAERKKHWIDFNAGAVLEGESFDVLLASLIALLIRTINGEHVANEQLNFKELAIFKSGVTL